MKYSFCSNMCYTLSKAMKYNKKLILRMLVYTISAVALPVLAVYFPKLIIDEITGARDITAIVEIMAGFLLAGILLAYISSFLQGPAPTAISMRFAVVSWRNISRNASGWGWKRWSRLTF